jgi:hypothetical protein
MALTPLRGKARSARFVVALRIFPEILFVYSEPNGALA